jgi:Ricin-type beta-trefoil lectin domain
MTMARMFARIAAVVMLAGLGATTGVAGANAQPVPSHAVTPFVGEFHPIVNVGSNMCLQPQNPGFGARIVQATCDGGTAQQWFALSMGSNHYRLLNNLSGWCMFVGDTPSNGGLVWQDECQVAGGTTVSNAEWTSSTALPGTVTLRTRVHFRDNNFCLDRSGLDVQLLQCLDNYVNQQWVVGI